jgi:aryl-alcohol dehydrogenase-like predicted oxidoreductase
MQLTFKTSSEGNYIVQDCDGKLRVLKIEVADILLNDWQRIATSAEGTLAVTADAIVDGLTNALVAAEQIRIGA